MDTKEIKTQLQAEIDLLENRLRSLPDHQVTERVEIRKKLIKKYIENGHAINNLENDNSTNQTTKTN